MTLKQVCVICRQALEDTESTDPDDYWDYECGVCGQQYEYAPGLRIKLSASQVHALINDRRRNQEVVRAVIEATSKFKIGE